MKKWVIIFLLFLAACGPRGVYNRFPIHVYDQKAFKGETGSIYAQVPLSVVKIDGLSIAEISQVYNRKKDPMGLHQEKIYLIPGEHTLTVQGGFVDTGSYRLTIKGIWVFKIDIEANQEYKIVYKETGKGTGNTRPVRVYIKNLKTGTEAGTIIEKLGQS